MLEIKKLIDSVVFASDKHKFQRRKGFLKIPYINHPLRVVKILSDCGETNTDLLIAAVLHDTVEDTDASLSEIEVLFGANVAQMVEEVTDNMLLPQKERKELQVQKASKLSDDAKKIKIADKICNINDLVNYPINWSKVRKIEYVDWSERVFEGLKGVNLELDKLFVETIEMARKGLNKVAG